MIEIRGASELVGCVDVLSDLVVTVLSEMVVELIVSESSVVEVSVIVAGIVLLENQNLKKSSKV